MPRKYDQETKNKCFQLYLRYNGKHHERILAGMRREYPWFSINRIAAWAEEYRWDEALKISIETQKRVALTSAEDLHNEIEEMRKRLYSELKGTGEFDKEKYQLYRDYARLSQEQLVKVTNARDTLGAFVAFWERVLGWLPDYSRHAAEALLQVEEQILKRAAEEYAEDSETEASRD